MASPFPETSKANVLQSDPEDDGLALDPAKMLVMFSNQKPFQCGLCSVSFGVNEDLVVHVHAHFIYKPYQCGLCKVSYESNLDLVTHVQVHNVFVCLPVDADVRQGDSASTSYWPDSACQHLGKGVGLQAAGVNSCKGKEKKRQRKEKHEQYIIVQEAMTSSTNCGYPSETESYADNWEGNTEDVKDCILKQEADTDDNDTSTHDGDSGSDGEGSQDDDWTTASSSNLPVPVPVKIEVCDNQEFPMESTPQSAHGLSDSLEDGDVGSSDISKPKRIGVFHYPIYPQHSNSQNKLRIHRHSTCSTHDFLKRPLCEKTFLEEHDLKAYCKVDHEATEVGPIEELELTPDLSDIMQCVDDDEKYEHVRREQCRMCSQQFDSVSELRAHLHSAHTVNGRFLCPVCDKSFSDLNGLKQHFKTCHEEGDKRPFQCSECNKKFKLRHHLRDHMQAIHGDKIKVKPRRTAHDCPVCQLHFESVNEVEAHLQSTHVVEGGFQCPDCEKTFRVVDGLRKHYKICHSLADARPHQCGQCEQAFKMPHHLRDHLRTVHGANEKKTSLTCIICEKIFKSKRSLKLHFKVCYEETDSTQTVHNQEKDSICSVCGETVSTLETHMSTVHPGVKPFKCKFCDSSFRIQKRLKTHLETHLKEKPFVCETCGKAFSRSTNLAYHRNTHTNAKPFSCDVCQMRFNSVPGMLQHKRRHTGFKPHACEICGMRFSASNSWRRHALTHTDKRPWSCDKCEKTYRSNSSLQYHKTRLHSMS